MKFLEDIRGRDNSGADSVIFLHPHAPREGIVKSSSLGMNYVMAFPQTFTISQMAQYMISILSSERYWV